MAANRQPHNTQPVVLHQTTGIVHSGPLPPAQEFERYEKTYPGAAERILLAAEKEAAHRHALENKMVDDNSKSARLGQYLAFAIAIMAMTTVILIGVFKGPTVSAIVPAVVACTMLAAVFLPNRGKAKK